MLRGSNIYAWKRSSPPPQHIVTTRECTHADQRNNPLLTLTLVSVGGGRWWSVAVGSWQQQQWQWIGMFEDRRSNSEMRDGGKSINQTSTWTAKYYYHRQILLGTIRTTYIHHPRPFRPSTYYIHISTYTLPNTFYHITSSSYRRE